MNALASELLGLTPGKGGLKNSISQGSLPLVTQSDVLAGRIHHKLSKKNLLKEVFPMTRNDNTSKPAKNDHFNITHRNGQKISHKQIMRKHYTSVKMKLMAHLLHL